jgi:hypothetical protein
VQEPGTRPTASPPAEPTPREKALLAALDRLAKIRRALAAVQARALPQRIGMTLFTVLFGAGVLVCVILAVIDLSLGLQAGQPRAALPVVLVPGGLLLALLVVLRIVAVVERRKLCKQITALQADVENQGRQLLSDFPEARQDHEPALRWPAAR